MDDPLAESAKAAQEGAKAVQEIAKTTGKGIDASREAAGFLAKLFGGSLDQAAGILEDRLRYTRWERRQRLVLKARKFAREHGLPEPTRRVPLRLLVPLLEAGAAEEDDELQDTWARMLANAADADHGAEVRRAYVSVLADCTRSDVRVLATLYNMPRERLGKSVRTDRLPNEALSLEHHGDRSELSAKLKRSLRNLIRLGLVTSDMASPGDWQLLNVSITALGIVLVEACILRDREAPGHPAAATSAPG